ncbi:hypothetical protein KJ693_00165 [bacterium]|nr:hypothetical protein [bacterium]MBU1613706.1 hypothetical protein [bacterium]
MQMQTTMDESLINEGLQTLVTNLGYARAARFIMSIGRGKGDSVKEFKKMWKDKTVDDICREIEEAKRKGEL